LLRDGPAPARFADSPNNSLESRVQDGLLHIFLEEGRLGSSKVAAEEKAQMTLPEQQQAEGKHEGASLLRG
jgi:hypothetical protein